jgi:hypothetical protein
MKTLTIILSILLLGAGIYFLFFFSNTTEVEPPQSEPREFSFEEPTPEPEPEPKPELKRDPESIIGRSVNGNSIIAYHYGDGDEELLFIGGMHGGYSWNTPLVAYQLMDYLESNPSVIPENLTVTVIPVLNPDGLEEVVGTAGRFARSSVPASQAETIPGRFNANDVDLNRNFDCDWQAEGTWQSRTVSGGDAPFSEPESRALKNYVENYPPRAVVVWYSAVGGVFASNCRNGVLPETLTLTNLYADASGYKAYETFDFYEITGDAVNWFAKNNVPAISVLLTTHEDTEWAKNQAGVNALLEYFGS